MTSLDKSITVEADYGNQSVWVNCSYIDTADKLDVLSNELADVLSSGFGREVVEIDNNSSKTINRSR